MTAANEIDIDVRTPLLIFIICVIIVLAAYAFGMWPELRFWNSDTENKAIWCEIYRPGLNQSLYDEDVKFCYTEYWNVYCRISQPHNCISHNNMTYKDAKELFLKGVFNEP